MTVPDIAALQINGKPFVQEEGQPEDERYFERLKNYAKSLPYEIESHEKMMKLFDFILLRITQCVEAKDFDVGMLQWDSMLT
jgi:proteasome activator subunit 4